MQPRSFSGRNPPVWKAPVSLIINWRGPGGFLPTSADSATLGSIVIVLASHLRPPPDMSPYLLNLIKNILLISPMHIIHKILWGIFISSRIQHRGDQSCKVNLVRSFCVEMQKKKPTREDIVSASLVTPITVPITAVDPWSLLLTEMQKFTRGMVQERQSPHLSDLVLFCFDSFLNKLQKQTQHQQTNHEMTWLPAEVMIN